MSQFTAVLLPDLEDGGYTVTVPALPGCITEGDTLNEALANARDAIKLYLEDVEASGEPPPQETASPLLQAVRV